MTDSQKATALLAVEDLLRCYGVKSVADLADSRDFEYDARTIERRHKMKIEAFSLSQFGDEIRFIGMDKIVEYRMIHGEKLEHIATRHLYRVHWRSRPTL
jgi:hypothetical protein